MPNRPEDICPRPERLPPQRTRPLSEPIHLASVYQCHDPQQADAMLGGTMDGNAADGGTMDGGEMDGYVYRRDGHPNADLLAKKCCQLHGAERAAITSSGMGALALAILSQLQQGDHIVVSSLLYGRSTVLLTEEASRLGMSFTMVDTSDLEATRRAMQDQTRLLVVETITNPCLRISDLEGLAEIAHARDALLLVDNTFASPLVCRPIEFGADLVLESLTKFMNGHSDVVLGLLCGSAKCWERVPSALSSWGMNSSPMDCYLASRGLGTLALRVKTAAENARNIARWLCEQANIKQVHYPGLSQHPDHALACRQFDHLFGAVVTFTLSGGESAAATFITASKEIPFCPSLGEISTTLSHPLSTSHRNTSENERRKLQIEGGTIRLSVGIESTEWITKSLAQGLSALADSP